MEMGTGPLGVVRPPAPRRLEADDFGLERPVCLEDPGLAAAAPRLPPSPPRPRIMDRICLNWSTSALTSAGRQPEPAAMRWRRDASMMSGSARSTGVIGVDHAGDAADTALVDVGVPHLPRHPGHHAEDAA